MSALSSSSDSDRTYPSPHYSSCHVLHQAEASTAKSLVFCVWADATFVPTSTFRVRITENGEAADLCSFLLSAGSPKRTAPLRRILYPPPKRLPHSACFTLHNTTYELNSVELRAADAEDRNANVGYISKRYIFRLRSNCLYELVLSFNKQTDVTAITFTSDSKPIGLATNIPSAKSTASTDDESSDVSLNDRNDDDDDDNTNNNDDNSDININNNNNDDDGIPVDLVNDVNDVSSCTDINYLPPLDQTLFAVDFLSVNMDDSSELPILSADITDFLTTRPPTPFDTGRTTNSTVMSHGNSPASLSIPHATCTPEDIPFSMNMSNEDTTTLTAEVTLSNISEEVVQSEVDFRLDGLRSGKLAVLGCSWLRSTITIEFVVPLDK